MTFDWTITLGNILSILGFLGGVVAFFIAVRRDITELATRLEPLETALDKLTLALEAIVRHDERVKALERDRDAGYPGQQWRKPRPR